MKRVSTSQLIPGMVLARDVISLDGQLILSAGTMLNDKMITKLDIYGIFTAFIQEDPTEQKVTFQQRDASYSRRIRNSEAFKKFKVVYDIQLGQFRDELNAMVSKNLKLDVEKLLGNSLRLIAGVDGTLSILDILNNMREYDDSTYAHSMNVALISNIIARWLKMSEDEIRMATTCGLLHDVGKILVPHDIIAKPGKLTDAEFAVVQKHPVTGYQLLRRQELNEHICNAALMHHERMDGTGYPMRLSGGQIDPFARIVAIADVYDAMTAARVYRGPMCPFRVIELYESEGYEKYDVEYLLTFLENVVNTFVRNRCLLSDGREGDIVLINKGNLSRPVVQCGIQYVNLAEHPELRLESIL